ncbi:MAG: hypothetical protein BZY75_05500 [SAR202 cluster bacterium Io17-Chloro-G7]|nr:MAG: hypothetical protein BZY75_05500 [SAR202 cluster bacterium Io17-Chloro-G7]
MPTELSAMKTKDFLETLPELVRAQVPPELSEFKVHPRVTSLTKFYYSRATVHYEIAVQKRNKTVEVGLHFEGEPETNFRHLELLQSLSGDIRCALGGDVAIEEWVRGWTRAYQLIPLEPLTDDFLVEVSFKVSGMIRALEPLLRSEPLP